MIALLSFKTGDLIFFFCAWKSPDRFPTGRGLSRGQAWASRILWARLRLQFWKAEAAKSRALPMAFRPSRAGTTLIPASGWLSLCWRYQHQDGHYFVGDTSVRMAVVLLEIPVSGWTCLSWFVFTLSWMHWLFVSDLHALCYSLPCVTICQPWPIFSSQSIFIPLDPVNSLCLLIPNMTHSISINTLDIELVTLASL